MLDTLRGQTLAAGFAGFAASSAAFLILAGTGFAAACWLLIHVWERIFG